MNKRYIYLCILISIAIGIRLLYGIYHPELTVSIDGAQYYGMGNQIVSHPTIKTIINPYRTPLYPLFLSGTVSLSGYHAPAIGSREFTYASQSVIFMQSFFGVLSVCILYFTLLLLSIDVSTAFLISTCMALNIFLFSWERTALTESMALTLVLGSTYILIRTILNPHKMYYIYLFFLFTLGWLLRPNLLIIPLVSLPLLLLAKPKKIFVMLTILLFVCTIIPPVIFSMVNAKNYGYMGISQVSDIDLLGQVLAFHEPVEAGKSFSFFYTSVVDTHMRHGSTNPFDFISYYDPALYGNGTKMNELQGFVHTVVLANLMTHIQHTITQIPNVFSDIDGNVLVVPNPHNGLTTFFYGLQTIYRITWLSGYLIFFLWPIVVWKYIRAPSRMVVVMIVLSTIALSIIATTVFMVSDDAGQEYARLVSVIQPLVYLFFIMCYNQLRNNVIVHKKSS